jgi:hypothetical protein
MRVTGGAIAVTAGIFGTIAAVLTLIIGLASAFEVEKAVQISWSEWGAVVAAFSTVFLGAICLHARSVSAGVLLIIASVSGGVVGGMFVAVFMALTFVGGAAASIGAIAETERLSGAAAGRALSDQSRLFGSRDGLQTGDWPRLTAAP